MNLLTLIGAAVGSEVICDQLFKDPVAAARALGLVLTETDVCALQALFDSENKSAICEHFGGIRTFICKRPPCPYTVALPNGQVTCDEAGDSAAA